MSPEADARMRWADGAPAPTMAVLAARLRAEVMRALGAEGDSNPAADATAHFLDRVDALIATLDPDEAGGSLAGTTRKEQRAELLALLDRTEDLLEALLLSAAASPT